jgi:hypothetical protein
VDSLYIKSEKGLGQGEIGKPALRNRGGDDLGQQEVFMHGKRQEGWGRRHRKTELDGAFLKTTDTKPNSMTGKTGHKLKTVADDDCCNRVLLKFYSRNKKTTYLKEVS